MPNLARLLLVSVALTGLALAPARAENPPFDLANLVPKLMPSVVSISFTSFESTSIDSTLSLVPKHQGVGTGYIVDEGGIIVTNRHVTDGGSEIFVTLADDTRLRAELIYRSPDIDMALLRVKPGHKLPVVTFGDSDTMRQGDEVIAIGNPLGLSGTVTSGIISARDRDIHETPFDAFMQIDASINPGNSGGPLFNRKGEVIGMNTALYSVPGATASGSIGLNFSIPINDVKFILENLHEYGRIRRGSLGAFLQNITPTLADAWGLPVVAGAIVASIQPDSPAAQAGLQVGDIVQRIGEKPIANLRGATRAIAALPLVKAPFEVLRGGKLLTLPVQLTEERMESATIDMKMAPIPRMRLTPAELGISAAMLTPELRQQFGRKPDLQGVVLTKVDPNLLGAYVGLDVGNVIVQAGEKKVVNIQDLADAADAARANKRNYLAVLIDDGRAQAWVAIPIEIGN